MSGDDPFNLEDSVFRDEHVFDFEYVPEKFLHRDTQMETLKYTLRPALRGSRPLNVMVRGPPGTGKTTAVKRLFGEFDGISGVESVTVNCQVDSTRYSVFSRLFEELFGYEPPNAGISFNKLSGQIADRLVKKDKVLVVALDDVNYLFYENEASDTLYSLLRAHEAHSDIKIGVIVVSSDLELDVIDSLDGRVQSIFRPEEVYFPTYDELVIGDILKYRTDRGFREGAIGLTVIHRAAELTAASNGDLRVGIDLLRRAGLNAEMRGATEVLIEDLEEAYEKAKHIHLSRHLRGLSDSERAFVRVLADHSGKQAGHVYDAFQEETGLGYTRYTEIINKLDQLGLVDAQYTDVEGTGRTRELSLTYDSDAILTRL